MSFKKKLKLLLTKEEGKMSKMNIALGSIVFFSLDSFSYSLNKQLFDITEPSNVQHLHNVIIKINETEPTDITFNYQKKDSCLVIYEVGAHRGWKDIENVLNKVGPNNFICNNNTGKITCIALGVRTSSHCSSGYYWDTGLVKYEYYYNDTSGICKSLRGTFETSVYTSNTNDYNCRYGHVSRSNIWKNII